MSGANGMLVRALLRAVLRALCGLALAVCSSADAQDPLLIQTNARVRILASNLSSGNYQRYEAPGLAILKGLKPDVVAVQEFNYASSTGGGINTPGAFREMIDQTFGTNFVYFRESSSTETYTIPNGIISRYAILNSGSWDDPQILDRGFAWAQLALPGTNAFYLVSVHLKASSSSSATRATEATRLKTLIQSSFPANSFVVLAGDFNIATPSEAALATFKTFLVDSPVPTDAASGGDADTNLGRSERYDYVLPSPELARLQAPVSIGTQSFSAGLVFDSRVYSPLTDVPPVASTDSSAPGMQHMAVVKDFIITYTITNRAPIAPRITILPGPQLAWTGLSNFNYIVQSTPGLEKPSWTTAGIVSSPSGTLTFIITNQAGQPQLFYRVLAPN
jgi:endonuclease/exonuclease/phosphatase family metal-dependent hydrolase